MRCLTLLTLAFALSPPCFGEDSETAIPPETPIDDSDRDHWAYRPLEQHAPPDVADAIWSKGAIDRFVRAAMDEAGVRPLPQASRAALLRRVTFDLTGLPPSAVEVRQFLADDAPDAYDRLVDRLLASPAYGERFAQHWLDLARYAETDGFEHDLVRPNAWRYRDWVIDALNADMPYDEFLRQQVAGDVLYPGDPSAAVATGFLLCGPDMPDLNLQEERRHLLLNEITSTVGATVLAMQFGCAQCHDHKYDPISQLDFYRLRAFFETSELFDERPIPTAEMQAARTAAEAAWTKDDRDAAKRRQALDELGRKRFRDKNPDERPTAEQVLAELDQKERDELAALDGRLKLLPELPELPLGRVVHDGEAHPARLYLRGDFRRPGPEVECEFPRVVCSPEEKPAAGSAPRAELASWLTRRDNALAARVIVNRAWQWHFGRGLSDSPSDFGQMGSMPSHPELLEWLAGWFLDDGRSLKRLHRLIVTSETYKLASGTFDARADATAEEVWTASSAQDAENALLWHKRRTRLDGEQVRDAMLACVGRLSSRQGGPGVRPPLPPEVTETLLKDQWRVSGDEEDHRRRSVYLFVRRNLRYPLFDVFDRPDTLASCPLRHESITATQSLVQLNSAFSLDCARHLAGRIAADSVDERDQIAQAYLAVLNRPASDEETQAAVKFLDRQESLLREEGRTTERLALPIGAPAAENPHSVATAHSAATPHRAAALVDFCLALFNASEFIYVD